MPKVADVDISTPPPTACASLRTRSSSPVPTCTSSASSQRAPSSALRALLRKESAAGAERGAGSGRHGLGLGDDVGISVGVAGDDVVQEAGEVEVFGQGVRGRRHGRRGPDCEVGVRWGGGEEGQETVGEGAWVWEDVLQEA